MSRDDVEVLVIAAACAGTVAVVGVLAMRLSRWRTMRSTLVCVAMISVLSVVAGVLGTSRAMFINSHDLRVLLPVTGVAAAVGLAVAVALGVAGARDVDRLRGRARLLGTGSPAPATDRERTRTQLDGRDPDRPLLRIRELDEIDAELVRARARLDDARAREQALEASRRDLIAWVSHDLRTPLAGLRAMAEALEDGVAGDPARYHRQMRREVDRLAGMVDDLFELSRIQAGALTLTLGHVDLFDVVDDVVQGSLPMAEAGGVRLGADAVHAAVRADPGELSRVLANLVVNAIRHTPSDGSVQVAGRVDGEHAVLSVSDGCGGIGDEELKRVFEAGWRGTPARTPGPDGGAGLGLAIARGIVEAHAGQIRVENTGTGCRFDVLLPRLPVH